MLNTKDEIGSSVKVYVDKDMLKAYVLVLSPSNNGRPCTYEDLTSALERKRIIFGIKEEKIREALHEKNWEREILVAEGVAAVDGKDASLEYIFSSKKDCIPKMDSTGNVDFHDLGIVNNVCKGDLLVTKIPCVTGRAGTDVFGNEIPAKTLKAINLPRGKNTVADTEGSHLYAAIDGHINVLGDKVEINPVFNVAGDVDYSSGNIDFIGSVVIKGNVTSGFKVMAGGDVEIQGFVEGADICAKGSIFVKGGINGKMKGKVAAGINILARFIENAIVEAGHNILVKEAIIQSNVKAGHNVKVSDNKAIIVGGIIQAAEEIESKVLGSQLATQTIVEVGVNPYIKEEYYKLLKDQNVKSKEYKNISHNLQIYNKSGVAIENLNEKKKEMLIKLLDYYQKLRNELQEIEQRIEQLEKELKRYQNAGVKVLDVVYPGVRINIGDQIFVVNDPVKCTKFLLEDGEIKTSALR